MKLISIFIVLFVFTSCIREVEYEVKSIPKELVVNSIIQANHLIVVNVSALASIFDSTYQFIDDATVCISTGNFVDTLTNQGNGNYLSNKFAYEGGIYSLSLGREGYPMVFAVDTDPFLSKIIKTTETKMIEVDEYGDPIYEYSITFESNITKPQNYELMFVQQSKSRDDGTYYFRFNNFDVEVDPIIQKAGINNISSTYFFSSKEMTADFYTLRMKMQWAYGNGGHFKEPLILTGNRSIRAVVLRTVSQSYVDYRISWEKHLVYRNDSSKVEDLLLVPLLGQQQEMYSNIENGQGVFVSYCQSYFILDYD